MRCFKGKERNLLQQHEITTSEKVFIFHGNFIQGIHVVEIDNTFQTSAVPPRNPSCHDIGCSSENVATVQVFFC